MSDMKEYLGDGVYVDMDDERIMLTTENGIHKTNVIYLGLDVYKKFVKWFEGNFCVTRVIWPE